MTEYAGCRFDLLCVQSMPLRNIQKTAQCPGNSYLPFCQLSSVTVTGTAVSKMMMWLAKIELINHHILWFIFCLSQSFCTLHCYTYMNQTSRCTYRCPHRLCTQDLTFRTCHCVSTVNIGPSNVAVKCKNYLSTFSLSQFFELPSCHSCSRSAETSKFCSKSAESTYIIISAKHFVWSIWKV